MVHPDVAASHRAARDTALDTAQEQLSIAIGHLHAVLHDRATYHEQQLANCAARDWLVSIGSDPQTAAAALRVTAVSSPPPAV
jgi:hypothetical protein